MKPKDKVTSSNLRSSYITSTLSISLVLFLLGLICLLVLNAKNISDYVKENIGFSVIMKDNVKEVDILRLKKQLDAKNFVKSTKYFTKEENAQEVIADLGEDFVEFLGYNHLEASIDVKLQAQYANMDSIQKIEELYLSNELIKEVLYQTNLVHLVNENVRKISFVILAISGVLFIIAFALINNTVRLSLFSKRFLIRTMQLVGASNGFIRQPFLTASVFQGIFAAFLAIIYLFIFVYLIQKEVEGFFTFENYTMLGILMGAVVGLGIVINWISTFFAVRKYLQIRTDKLFYY